MATVNLGAIKFNWKGTYNASTAYTIDDVVEYNGSSYVCKLASTGNLPTNTTYFDQMSAKGTDGTNGTDGTDLTTTLTTQGDILYRDGSGLARLPAGTAGDALITNGTGANPSWGTVSAGKVLQVLQQTTTTRSSFTDPGSGNNPEIARLIPQLDLGITPSATSSKILINVTIVGASTNDSFGNISVKTSSQSGQSLGDAHTGTLLHPTSPSGQSPTLSGDFWYTSESSKVLSRSYNYLHSPNSTSTQYYCPTMTAWSGSTFYLNRSNGEGNDGWYGAGMSTITLMEIGA